MSAPPIRVLIVDDSAIVRKILSEVLRSEPGIEVAGTAPDAYVAAEKIRTLKPDVVTLDIEMPRMDGLTFLRKIMQSRPVPVIVVSSLAQESCAVAVEALRSGAVDILAKPAGPYSVGELRAIIASKIRAAAVARLRSSSAAEQSPSERSHHLRLTSSAATSRIVAMGASTGGTEAIETILRAMPANAPPVLATQHIPAGFSRAFAERLNSVCRISVKEAADGDEVVPGRALIAPGGYHMLLRKHANGYRARIADGPPVCYQRPSVDILFHSVAEAAGARSVGALLTGMGSDGARGLLRMRDAGAETYAQDEASCVVFGMPREAILLGAARRVVPLHSMAGAILGASAASSGAR
jgi:two-component system chemotaxis response regulator CheB